MPGSFADCVMADNPNVIQSESLRQPRIPTPIQMSPCATVNAERPSTGETRLWPIRAHGNERHLERSRASMSTRSPPISESPGESTPYRLHNPSWAHPAPTGYHRRGFDRPGVPGRLWSVPGGYPWWTGPEGHHHRRQARAKAAISRRILFVSSGTELVQSKQTTIVRDGRPPSPGSHVPPP